ncbi:hypothetical protein ACFQ4K_13380 [Tistrella bauzanensis]
MIEQAAHLDTTAMQVVSTTIEALPTPGEVALWAESASTAKLIETAEALGHAPGALPPEVLAANARLVERLDTFEQNRDDILARPDADPPAPPRPDQELAEHHARQQEVLDHKLDEMRAMQEARIARGDVRDPDALRAAMDKAAERERQMLEQRQEAERQRAAMEQAEREAAARQEALMLAARQR